MSTLGIAARKQTTGLGEPIDPRPAENRMIADAHIGSTRLLIALQRAGLRP